MNIGGLFFGSKRQSGLFGTPSPAAVQFVTILACLTVTLAISFAAALAAGLPPEPEGLCPTRGSLKRAVVGCYY